jgi:hypothetical protein
MMAEPYFEIKIEDGKLTAEGHGFEGAGCEDIAKLIRQLGKTEEHRRKPEFYRRAGYAARRAKTE